MGGVNGAQEDFQRLYYAHWSRRKWYWCGHNIVKYGTDLLLFQEIIFRNRPDLLIETGTLRGGSAIFFASLFDLIGHGQVISIDKWPKRQPPHARVTYLTGGSTSVEVLQKVKELADGKTCMVTLDSDHRALQVKRELERYSPLVTVGQYLVVEDTILGHGVARRDILPGPAEALQWFLGRTKDFVVDQEMSFIPSLNPGGYLRRIS